MVTATRRVMRASWAPADQPAPVVEKWAMSDTITPRPTIATAEMIASSRRRPRSTDRARSSHNATTM
jgi:hypothetical protein